MCGVLAAVIITPAAGSNAGGAGVVEVASWDELAGNVIADDPDCDYDDDDALPPTTIARVWAPDRSSQDRLLPTARLRTCREPCGWRQTPRRGRRSSCGSVVCCTDARGTRSSRVLGPTSHRVCGDAVGRSRRAVGPVAAVAGRAVVVHVQLLEARRNANSR